MRLGLTLGRTLGDVHATAARMALLPIGAMSVVYACYGAAQWATLGSTTAAWDAVRIFLRSVPGASLFAAAAAVAAFWQGSRLSERTDGRRALAHVLAAAALAVWFHFAAHLLGAVHTAEGAPATLPLITLTAAVAGHRFRGRPPATRTA